MKSNMHMYHAFIVLLLLLAPAVSLKIVCGWHHNCVFEHEGTAMKCWGLNNNGELGYGDTSNRDDPSNLPLVHIGTDFVVEVMSLGLWHSCAMSDDRAIKCFGDNAYSQLGFDGLTTTGDALPFLAFELDFSLLKIAAGYHHTCALSTDAALKCFGRNNFGQCGSGTATSPISGPPSQINAIDLGTDFTPIDVQTLGAHVCVLSQQQTLKCFGLNDEAQLGYGDFVDRGNTPESMGDALPVVKLGSNFIVAAIATGYAHSCALSTTNTVKCWGWNRDGQCGTPHSTETGDDLPVLEFGADFVPMQLALGGYHTCILSETATVICFGWNFHGQLGIGSTTDVDTPSTLTGIDLGSNFVPRQVAAGLWHTCAVSTNDGIKCWGFNYFGQLGLGHTNKMGDGPNEMGDDLPFVDVGLPTASPTTTTKQPTASPSTTASPTTPTPTTASPTTASPITASPTTASPTTATPTTATPTTATPTTASPTTATPTMTTPTTASPTTASPTTASPTTASPTTASPTTATPTTATPTTASPTSTTPTTSAPSSTPTANPSVSPATELTTSDPTAAHSSTLSRTTSSPTKPDNSNTVTVPSVVIEATLREAMVNETEETIETTRQPGHDDDDDAGVSETESHSWRLLIIAACGATVCCCCVAAAIWRCVELARQASKRKVRNGAQNRQQAAQLQIEFAALPLHAAPNLQALGSESDVESEERKEDIDDIDAAHAFANQVQPVVANQASILSNRPEGLPRAPIIAQPTAGSSASDATELNLEEDEFEVVDDDSVFHFRNSVFH